MRTFIRTLILTSLSLGILSCAFAQQRAQEETPVNEANVEKIKQRLNPDAQDAQKAGKTSAPGRSLTFTGSIDAYYAVTTDSAALNNDEILDYQNISPRANQVGLNALQFGAKYDGNRIRGNFSIFYGDVPRFTWDRSFNNIQEANIGFKITDGLWADAGFFNAYVGSENFLPAQNNISSLTLGAFHSPYYLSGARLKWNPSDLLEVQGWYVNAANSFLDRNETSSHGYGLLVKVTPGDDWTIQYSNLIDDQAVRGAEESMWRAYNTAFVKYDTERFGARLATDFGMQENSLIEDGELKSASFINGHLEARYNFVKNAAVVARYEYFWDEDGVLSTPMLTEEGEMQGLVCNAFTFGVNYNPTQNSYLRLETQFLSADDKQYPFTDGDGEGTNQRVSLFLTAGVNFDSGNLLK